MLEPYLKIDRINNEYMKEDRKKLFSNNYKK
jgi:hypothetical protein